MLLFQKYNRIASARIFCIAIHSSFSPNVHGKMLQDEEENRLHHIYGNTHLSPATVTPTTFWILRSDVYLRCLQ